ncbi:MAG: RsmE family RNA methyltransferase [Phycisphaerales bacterium]
MSLHRISLDHAPPPAGNTLTLTDEEAWHAVAVKRLQAGDTVELLDGRGTVATAAVTATEKSKRGASIALRIERVEQRPPVSPRVEIWSAVPKADRAAQMIDQLAQAGAAVWRPLISERSVTDADAKLDRLTRIAAEASKQCGRPWHMTLDAPRTIADAAAWAAAHPATTLVTDGAGLPAASAAPVHLTRFVVLVGAEGGFTESELTSLKAAGATPLRLGPHILRTETAAVAAAVALLAR